MGYSCCSVMRFDDDDVVFRLVSAHMLLSPLSLHYINNYQS